MHIIKRRITINGVHHDIWLGLVNKGYRGQANIHLYYYTGDPDNEFHQPQPLKTGFKSEDEAIDYGKSFMRNLLLSAMAREDEIAKRGSEPDGTKID
jgi:hypothetical protein